mgnify:CR=1 FL=1
MVLDNTVHDMKLWEPLWQKKVSSPSVTIIVSTYLSLTVKAIRKTDLLIL